MYSQEQVARTIDHAVLKPFATRQDVIDNAKMCDERQVATMCVRPCDVALAAEANDGAPAVQETHERLGHRLCALVEWALFGERRDRSGSGDPA